jgi:hypothetical protein
MDISVVSKIGRFALVASIAFVAPLTASAQSTSGPGGNENNSGRIIQESERGYYGDPFAQPPILFPILVEPQNTPQSVVRLIGPVQQSWSVGVFR